MSAKKLNSKMAVSKNGQVKDMFNVSQSKVKTYRRCHYAFHLRYVEKLRKKIKSRPLQFGTLVHSVLEHWAEGSDWDAMLDKVLKDNSKVFKAERDAYGEIIDDIRMIMTEYFIYYEDDKQLRFERINGKSAEHVFNIEILPGVNWNGKIDFRGRTPNKRSWLGEHKTFNRRPSPDDRWRNLQSATYIRANDILGWKPVDGVCWDYIWSKAPMRPQILQNGSMSNKDIDTLPSMVRLVAEAEGLKRRQYGDMLQKSGNNHKKWFERVFAPVNEDVVEGLFQDFISTIEEMRRGHNTVKDKNVERHCSWCDYNEICKAELQGLDVDYVRQRQYTTEKDDGLEIPEPTD